MNNTSNSSVTSLVPGGVVTTQNISSVISPKINNNSMQFVKIQTPDLSKKAAEQIRVAHESNSSKEKIKEVEEEWQNNLLNWKAKRRQQIGHTIDTDENERNNLSCELNDANSGRKGKTFAEMIEQRAKRGTRLNFNLQRYIGSGGEEGDEDGDDSGEHEPSSSSIGIDDDITKEEFENLAKDRLDSDCGVRNQQTAHHTKEQQGDNRAETNHPQKQQFHSHQIKQRIQDFNQLQMREEENFQQQQIKQRQEEINQLQQQRQHMKQLQDDKNQLPRQALQHTSPPPPPPPPPPQKNLQLHTKQLEQQEIHRQLQIKKQQELQQQKQEEMRQQELHQRQLQIQQKQQQELHQQQMRQHQLELEQQQLKQKQEQMLFERKREENEHQERLLRQKLERQHIQDDLVHHRSPPTQVTNSHQVSEAISQRTPSSRVQLPIPQEPAKNITTPTKEATGAPPRSSKRDHRTVLSISGKKRCSSCKEELGRGAAAFVVESLNLVYHTVCFRCSVCHVNLADGFRGVDVRVHEEALHCQNCYSKDGLVYSRV